MCLAAPLSLGKDTARLNPKLSTSPITRKINLVGQTKLIIHTLAKITNHTQKNSEKIQILFVDRLDHKPTIHRPQQTHRKRRRLHQIDLHKRGGEPFIEIQKERRNHLANNYGPEGLWQTKFILYPYHFFYSNFNQCIQVL